MSQRHLGGHTLSVTIRTLQLGRQWRQWRHMGVQTIGGSGLLNPVQNCVLLQWSDIFTVLQCSEYVTVAIFQRAAFFGCRLARVAKFSDRTCLVSRDINYHCFIFSDGMWVLPLIELDYIYHSDDSHLYSIIYWQLTFDARMFIRLETLKQGHVVYPRDRYFTIVAPFSGKLRSVSISYVKYIIITVKTVLCTFVFSWLHFYASLVQENWGESVGLKDQSLLPGKVRVRNHLSFYPSHLGGWSQGYSALVSSDSEIGLLLKSL